MTHPPELDHLVIAITDWERSNEFYGRVLRAEVIPLSMGEGYENSD